MRIDMKNLDYLLPKTRRILEILNNSDIKFLNKFVLVGGSALSLHLKHRQSEDLDFFTYCDYFDKEKIFGVMNYYDQKEILNETNDQVDMLLDRVKVTFFNAKWSFLEPESMVKNKINIAKIENIAGMKVNTLFLRAKFRDYYDLYAISKKMDIKQIYENAQKIVTGINFKLFSAAIIFTDDIEDDNIEHLNPVYNISKKEISDYFVKLLKRLKNENR